MAILLLVIGIVALIVGIKYILNDNIFNDKEEDWKEILCLIIVCACLIIPFKKEFSYTLEGDLIYGHCETYWASVITSKPYNKMIVENAFGVRLYPLVKCYHWSGNTYRSNLIDRTEN